MHTKTLKKLALALTLWLALHVASLKAQVIGPYGSSPTVFEVDANGLLSSTGTFGTGSLSISGAGTRMIWYPGKAAFRAGKVLGTKWNDGAVGDYSVAMGYDTKASDTASTAFGYQTVASGVASTAFGLYSTASGFYSFALGDATTASGNYSTAAGLLTTASSYASFVIGSWNVGLNETGGSPSASSWTLIDPLFEIGNGQYTGATSDALIVYKNGDTKIFGADNQMPNQTLTGANSVLTEGLADTRYLVPASATTLALFGGTSTGINSIALGSGTTSSGTYTFASGYNSTATALYSLAMGYGNTSDGNSSTAIGYDNTASVSTSTALGGWNSATNNGSTAIGQGNTSSGNYASTAIGFQNSAAGISATALGNSNWAYGTCSTALGHRTYGYGDFSTASGYGSNAGGVCSTASGYWAWAIGDYSTALGFRVVSGSYASFAAGKWNVGGGSSASTWVDTDPLLELGNGTDSDHTSDALVVYKNGNATFQGAVTGQAGLLTTPASTALTDIPMFSGE